MLSRKTTPQQKQLPDAVGPRGRSFKERPSSAQTVARRRFLQWLEATYRTERLGNKRNPLDEVIFIILSKQTQHPVYSRTYRALRKRYPRWEELADARVEEVEAIIKEAGFARQRAKHLVSLARELRQRYGRVSLSHLAGMETGEAETFLESLPGIGTKTAKCVLMYSLDRHALPIDVHTLRFAKRLRLLRDAGAEARTVRTQRELEAAIPPENWYSFHVGAVKIGREWCMEHSPRCAGCPAVRWCPTGQSNLLGSRRQAVPSDISHEKRRE